PADHSRAEGGDRLERPARGVRGGVEGQRLDDGRRNPPGAYLVSRERRLIAEAPVRAGLAELPRAGRSSRPAADHEDVTGLHSRGAPGQSLVRVQGIALGPLRANTTWNSCSDPVMNATSDPARYRSHARRKVSSNISVTRSEARRKRSRQCSSVLA